MTQRPNPYPLRIDKEILEKVKVIARGNGRSLNKEIEIVLRQYKDDYESKNGVISIESTNQN